MTNTTSPQQTADHPTALWARRESDPENSRRRLEAMRELMTLTDLAKACGADKSQLRVFLRPAPPAEQIEHLNRLLRSIPRNREAIAAAIAELRGQGWSMAEIGRATNRSRQRIAVLADHRSPQTSTVTESFKPDEAAPRTSPRPAPHYRQSRSLTDDQLAPLLQAHQIYLTARRCRTGSAHQPDRLAAELALAEAAQALSSTTRVPLAALSARLGMARATLPAICRRAGTVTAA